MDIGKYSKIPIGDMSRRGKVLTEYTTRGYAVETGAIVSS